MFDEDVVINVVFVMVRIVVMIMIIKSIVIVLLERWKKKVKIFWWKLFWRNNVMVFLCFFCGKSWCKNWLMIMWGGFLVDVGEWNEFNKRIINGKIYRLKDVWYFNKLNEVDFLII